MRQARRAVVFAAVALIVAAGAVAPAGAGKFGDVVAASVPPGSKLSPTGHYYLFEAQPGDAVTQIFRVTNTNDHPVTVSVEPVDATTGSLTGVQMGRPGSAKALTSRWIVVSTPEITLGPNEQRDVPFTVHVPPNTKAGQYLAGMSASVPLNSEDTTGTTPPAGRAGFSMAVRFQRAIAVEIDVPGPRAPNLQVSGAEPKATPGGVSLGVHISNDGNAFARGNGVIRVADTGTDFSFKIDTFVSQTAIVYPMQWTKRVVPGTHHIQVDLTYDGNRRTTWSGTVVIAGAAQTQLESALRNVTVPAHSSGPNLLLVLAIALIVVLMAAAIVVRRRSRARRPINYRTA